MSTGISVIALLHCPGLEETGKSKYKNLNEKDVDPNYYFNKETSFLGSYLLFELFRSAGHNKSTTFEEEKPPEEALRGVGSSLFERNTELERGIVI